jgi:hypothetical protein
MLHFAYGSNMSTALMRQRCPSAVALGTARLAGWRFVMTHDGYGSIASAAGGEVHGLLWRLRPRDLAALNAYEALDSGLYRRRMLPVIRGRRRVGALVYLGRGHAGGKPKPGYQELVVAAAQEWALPEAHIRALQRWLRCSYPAARLRETGETAWPM